MRPFVAYCGRLRWMTFGAVTIVKGGQPVAVYVVDAPAANELARRGFAGGGEQGLFAPTLLRSRVLAILAREVVTGRCDAGDIFGVTAGEAPS